MVAAWRGRGALGLAEDPWADALAGEDGRVLARRHDPSFPDAALWLAVRTRWLDDVELEVVDKALVKK